MNNYYVEGHGWFVVRTRTKRRARSVGVREYGRGNVRCVRPATQAETREYIVQRSEAAMQE